MPDESRTKTHANIILWGVKVLSTALKYAREIKSFSYPGIYLLSYTRGKIQGNVLNLKYTLFESLIVQLEMPTSKQRKSIDET